MSWMPFGRKQGEQRDLLSISDPSLVAFFGLGGRNDARMVVTEGTALGLTAIYRAVSLISGTVAGLPLKSVRTLADDTRERVPTFLDDPGSVDDLSPFEFLELVMVHLLLHGNAFLVHRMNAAGAVLSLYPIHPSRVSVEAATAGHAKRFKVTQTSGAQIILTSAELTHIPALSTDGVRGLSPIDAARQSIGTGLAADKTAARQFGKGLLAGGLVTTEEDVTEEEAKVLKEDFQERAAGHDNAGEVAFVNRNLKFTPWTVSGRDAQFIEGRAFQVEEVARLYGLPSILLSDSTKTTTWGAGVREVIQAMARFTLMPWTTRIEQRLSRLLPAGISCEFDYAGLLQGNQADVTANLIAEIGAGILLPNEARRILNRAPLPEPER